MSQRLQPITAVPVAALDARKVGRSARPPHLSREQRVARGRAAASEVPVESQALLSGTDLRADAVELLERQAATRVPELVPIRYGRMLVSPFAFYRGAALVMASDLAGTPNSGPRDPRQRRRAPGADALAAAGGDDTQALVATIAAQHDLPFACIPAGTRNHFALDLGVDRERRRCPRRLRQRRRKARGPRPRWRLDVRQQRLTGALRGGLQQQGYRDAKIRTILDTASTALSHDTRALRWTGPDGSPQHLAAVILVSNNVYRLGRVIGSGTRPRMDAGRLGITVMGAPGGDSNRRQPLRHWSATEFVVDFDSDIPVGVDGEALGMPAPLTFQVRPGALRVRIAPHHPGASPSAALPTGFRQGVAMLLKIVGGADPTSLTT